MDDQQDNMTPADESQAGGGTETQTAEASSDQEKRQIPGYQILDKLGAGAMAVVFKAKQISLDRIVAIKVLPKKLSSDKEYVERFYAEGQVAAKLNHSNIVQSIDVGEAHGYHYFVMEYVEGRTVYDYLAEGKVYSESEALDIIIQMAKALLHAHSLGLIHRDVKPKNIMITNDGVAKLMDMGLARVANDADAIAAEAGKLYGTPYYISPEQIVGKTDVDYRCDIYSLGATLYHMVTGHVPFDGKDSREVMIKHVKKPLTPPDRHNLDLSFGLCKVIEKMMAKDRKRRHASTQEMLEDLQSIDFLLEVENPVDEPITMPIAAQSAPQDRPKPKQTQPAQPQQAPAAAAPQPQPQSSKMNMALLIGLMVSLLLNVVLLALWLMK